MSIDDLDFALSKEHQISLAVQDMMRAISDLCDMASTGVGCALVRADIDDLELAHDRLGQLLTALRSSPLQQVA